MCFNELTGEKIELTKRGDERVPNGRRPFAFFMCLGGGSRLKEKAYYISRSSYSIHNKHDALLDDSEKLPVEFFNASRQFLMTRENCAGSSREAI